MFARGKENKALVKQRYFTTHRLAADFSTAVRDVETLNANESQSQQISVGYFDAREIV